MPTKWFNVTIYSLHKKVYKEKKSQFIQQSKIITAIKINSFDSIEMHLKSAAMGVIPFDWYFDIFIIR